MYFEWIASFDDVVSPPIFRWMIVLTIATTPDRIKEKKEGYQARCSQVQARYPMSSVAIAPAA